MGILRPGLDPDDWVEKQQLQRLFKGSFEASVPIIASSQIQTALHASLASSSKKQLTEK